MYQSTSPIMLPIKLTTNSLKELYLMHELTLIVILPILHNSTNHNLKRLYYRHTQINTLSLRNFENGANFFLLHLVTFK